MKMSCGNRGPMYDFIHDLPLKHQDIHLPFLRLRHIDCHNKDNSSGVCEGTHTLAGVESVVGASEFHEDHQCSGHPLQNLLSLLRNKDQ